MPTPAATPSRPHLRAIRALVVAALLWSVGLLVAAMALPLYGSDAVTSSTVVGGPSAPRDTTTVAHTTATLVEVNGYQVLVFVAVPLLAAVVVAVALLRPRPGLPAQLVAWGTTGVLGVLNLLAMLTVGIVIVPVTACLLMACAFDLGRGPVPTTPVIPG